MKKFSKRVGACALALCLMIMSVVPVAAAPDQTKPTADAVRSEALAAASYVLRQTDFTDLSDTSKFYNSSLSLILAIRAGADCSDETQTYLAQATKLVNADGTLNVPVAAYGYPNDTYSCYAYLLMVLALTGNDACSFNGANLVLAWNNLLKNADSSAFHNGYDTETYAVTGINPYHIGYIYSAVESYADLMPDYAAISAVLKKALAELTELSADNSGISYAGSFSADNNGTVYPHFANAYHTDAQIKNLIDNVLTGTQKAYYDAENGTSHTVYQDYQTGAVVDEPSPNSTALSLSLYAQFGRDSLAAASYHTLLSNYRSQTTPGAYTYAGTDSIYSSKDALNGLVTYLYALEQKANPFDVSDVRKASKPETPTPDKETSGNLASDNTASDNDTLDNRQPDNSTPGGDAVLTGDTAPLLLYIIVGFAALSAALSAAMPAAAQHIAAQTSRKKRTQKQ